MKTINLEIDPNMRKYVFDRETYVDPQLQRIRFDSKRIDEKKIDYLISKIDCILKRVYLRTINEL